MIVYLCGGINGLSDADCKDWRERAKELLAGHETLDPMRRDYRGIEGDHVWEIVNGDCCDIRESDIVLAMCERPSWGTAMEIRFAYEHGIPVIGVCTAAKPSPWLVYHCRSLHATLEGAVLAVVD
jgi:nucleoside 2-deoxyribosyltransferase